MSSSLAAATTVSAAAPSAATIPAGGAPPAGAGLRVRLARRTARLFDCLGLDWFATGVRACGDENRLWHLRRLMASMGLALLGIAIALLLWEGAARTLKVGTLSLPGPSMVAERLSEQWRDWRAQSIKQREHAAEVEKLAIDNKITIAEALAFMPFERKTLFVDQLWLSVKTVLAGVGVAILIGVTAGVVLGLSGPLYAMANPVIQVLKPVSPLAWFPIVYLCVNAAMPGTDHALPKNSVIAALVVSLCALWPTLLNTVIGVANVEKDYLNVARVLRLGFIAKIWRIVLPASIPYIFTGVRISFGVGWMVLIASEMMAVSQGMGMFIWNWYQSSNDVALSYFLMALIVIGAIGFLIDRLMVGVQRAVSHGGSAAIR